MKENDSFEMVSSKVATGSLTAKDVLKMVFACAEPLTDKEIVRQIRNLLGLGRATHVKSFGAATKLISTRAGEFLQKFVSDLQWLNETDREDVELAILSRLKQPAKVRRGGRPKGGKGHGIERQIALASALQFLGCSKAGMAPFLYPTQHRKVAAKQATYKFLKRYAVSLEQECRMNEGLACQIVKANITIRLAERIMHSTL